MKEFFNDPLKRKRIITIGFIIITLIGSIFVFFLTRNDISKFISKYERILNDTGGIEELDGEYKVEKGSDLLKILMEPKKDINALSFEVFNIDTPTGGYDMIVQVVKDIGGNKLEVYIERDKDPEHPEWYNYVNKDGVADLEFSHVVGSTLRYMNENISVIGAMEAVVEQIDGGEVMGAFFSGIIDREINCFLIAIPLED